MIRLLKIVVSTTLIVLLVWKADLGTFLNDLDRIDPVLLGAAISLLVLQYPISAWKWQVSLRLHNIVYPYAYLLRVLCIAFFFNNFLPTAIGGDAYRAYRTMDRAKRKAHPISAVILERLVGILALLLLGYVSAIYLIFYGELLHPEWVTISLWLATAGIVALAVISRGAVVDRILERIGKIGKLEPLVDSLRTLSGNRHQFGSLVLSSLVFQGTAIGAVATLFAALGQAGVWFQSGLTAAAAGVAGVLPVSINGIGVVEGSFVAAAWESGLPYEDAIIVALFLRVFMLASSVVFGLLYAIEPQTDRTVPEESTP